jgi:aminoglycoside 3-N-acetyltransferase I
VSAAGVRVRRLDSGDLASMRALNALFGAAFDDPVSYVANAPSDDYLARWLKRPHVYAVIAEHDGTVIGGLVAYELAKFEQARSEIYIYDLAVAEAARRQGVASALIEYLRVLAHEAGAWVIYVQADYEDPPAIALYEKLGTREEVLHFDITPLDRPRGEP